MPESSAGKRHYLNTDANIIVSSVIADWTQMDNLVGLSARLQGVYWDSTTVGAILRIKDASGEIVYEYEVDAGVSPSIDQIETPMTLRTPFSYYDSEGGNKIVLYGEYVDYPD